MSESAETTGPQTPEQLEQLLVDLMMQKTTLQIEKGITDDEMEALYGHGHGLYQAGKYDDAEEIFKYLGTHDPIEPKYFFALGGCYESRRQYQQAAKYYMQALLLNNEDPQSGVRAAICFRAAGMPDEAEGALHLAIEHSSGDPAHDDLKMQAAAMRDALEADQSQLSDPSP